MHIIAKSIQSANIVFVFPQGTDVLPEPQHVFSLFPSTALNGSNFTDVSALKIKIFDLPAMKIKVIGEESRLRIEDGTGKEPIDSKIANEAGRIARGLFPNTHPAAFGFNYDIFYRFDQVIPEREIMEEFIDPDIREDIRGFSWQFMIDKTKLKKQETYYFKIISPLEIALHVNHHFLRAPAGDSELQEFFEQCYAANDEIFKILTF